MERKPGVLDQDVCSTSEDVYDDEVGGHHDCGIGYNPNGVWCGECPKGTCKGCVNEHITQEILKE